jgi:hypothetical protein
MSQIIAVPTPQSQLDFFEKAKEKGWWEKNLGSFVYSDISFVFKTFPELKGKKKTKSLKKKSGTEWEEKKKTEARSLMYSSVLPAVKIVDGKVKRKKNFFKNGNFTVEKKDKKRLMCFRNHNM